MADVLKQVYSTGRKQVFGRRSERSFPAGSFSGFFKATSMTECTRLNFETGKLLKFRNSKFFGGKERFISKLGRLLYYLTFCLNFGKIRTVFVKQNF